MFTIGSSSGNFTEKKYFIYVCGNNEKVKIYEH